MKTYGSRDEVHCGIASRTRHGLTKADLVVSHGKIVSKKKHDMAVADKQAYLDKMNGPRMARRPAAVARSTGPVVVPALTVPASRPSRAEPTRESRLNALTAAANRTY